MKNITITICTITLLFTIFHTYAQTINNPDTITNLISQDFKDLEKYYNAHINDTLVSIQYAKAFLFKAQKENKRKEEIDGYYMLAKISKHDQALSYADSIIGMTVNNSNYNFPAEAHLLKAQIFGAKSKYQKAIDQLTKANQFANKNENTDQKFLTKYFIAILKNELGEHKESLSLLNKTTKYYQNKFNEDLSYTYQYIKCLYAYGHTFSLNKKYDSAYFYTNKAINLSLKSKNNSLYLKFICVY